MAHDKYFMQEADKRMEEKGTKGKLRRRLHVKKGEKIPAKKLTKAAHSRNPEERKEAALAKVFRKANHKRSARKRG